MVHAGGEFGVFLNFSEDVEFEQKYHILEIGVEFDLCIALIHELSTIMSRRRVVYSYRETRFGNKYKREDDSHAQPYTNTKNHTRHLP